MVEFSKIISNTSITLDYSDFSELPFPFLSFVFSLLVDHSTTIRNSNSLCSYSINTIVTHLLNLPKKWKSRI